MANKGSSIAVPGLEVSANIPQSVQLRGGQIWSVPVGNFMLKIGAESALQWFDQNSGLYHILETGQSNAPVFVESDGTNFQVINLSGTIQGATITANGTLYNQANATAAFAAPAAGNTATGTPIIGGSLAFTLDTGGAAYSNPYLVIPPPQLLGGTPGLCIPATANLSFTANGAITGINTGFAGAGYAAAPLNNYINTVGNTVTMTPAQYAQSLADGNPYNQGNPQAQPSMFIVDPTGSGAQITAATANGTSASGGVTGIIMTSPGSGYDGTHIPAITLAGTTGSGATATALPALSLTGVTVGGTNTGYSATIMFLSSLGASASPPVNVFGEPIQVRPARGTIAESGGNLGAASIEDAGGMFQTVPLLRQVGNATVDGSVNATLTAVVGGVNNTLLYWQVG